MSIKVLLADDHSIVREGLKAVLKRTAPDIVVAGEASNGNQALELAKKTPADAYVLDITMPFLNGLETMARLHELAGEMGVGYGKLAMVVNRLRRDELPIGAAELKQQLKADYLVGLPDNVQLSECDEDGSSLGGLPPDNEVVKRIDALLAEAGVINK